MNKKLWGIFLTTVSVGALLHQSSAYAELFADERYLVDFNESMEFQKKDSFAELRREKQNWNLVRFCRALYEKNNLQKYAIHSNPLIPKIIHLIWVGPLDPPPIFKKCIQSIKEVLPDWECRIWTDADIPGLRLQNQEFYDEETCYGAKADILRYELLYRFGGVYLDVDFVLRKPLDVLHHAYEFYTSMMPGNSYDTIANGVIGCQQGHPIIKACVDGIKDHRHHDHILHRTGPYYFQNIFYGVMKEHPYDRVVALPKSFFLPFDYEFLSLTEEKAQQIKEETLAIHYWANSWGASMPGAWGEPQPKKKKNSIQGHAEHRSMQNVTEQPDVYDPDFSGFIRKLRIKDQMVFKNKMLNNATIAIELSQNADSDTTGALKPIILRPGEKYVLDLAGKKRLLSAKLLDSFGFLNPTWTKNKQLKLCVEPVQNKYFLHKRYFFDFTSQAFSEEDLQPGNLSAETLESRRGFNGHLLWFDGVIAANEGLTLQEIDAQRRALYAKNNIAHILEQDPHALDREGYRIPLILHKIWVTADDNPISPPEHYVDYFEKSIDYNPPSEGWQHYFWVEDKSKLPNLVTRLEKYSSIKVMEFSDLPFPRISGDLYKKAIQDRQFGKASDILRGEILIQYGGYYLDTDYELFQSLKPYSKIYDMTVALEPMSVLLGNAFIGAKPNHPVIHTYLKLIIRNLHKETAPEYLDSDTGYSTIVATGPAVITMAFALAAGSDRNRDIALPPMLIYPTLFNRYPEQYVVTPDSPIPAESIGAHYWETAWMREEFGSKG